MNKLLVVSFAAVMFSASGALPAAADDKDTHAVHSKQMKSDAGVKDGEKMANPSVGAASQKGQHSHDEKGEAAGKDTHAVHSKAMKNDSGVKDGEKMENSR